MTVKTTIKFTADLGGALDATIEAARIAIMHASEIRTEQKELEDALAKIKLIRQQLSTGKISVNRLD